MVQVFLIQDDQQFEVPSSLVEVSEMIAQLITQSPLIDDRIEIPVNLPITSLQSLANNDHYNQAIIPVLDFLKCTNLITIGLTIICQERHLTDATKDIFKRIPTLSYHSIINGLLTIDELVAPDCTDLIDVDQLIQLLNIDVPPASLLPTITTRMLSTDVVIIQLLDRIDQLQPEVLDILIRHLPSSIILDRMVELRLFSQLRELDVSGYIPKYYDCSRIIADNHDDEMLEFWYELMTDNLRSDWFSTIWVLMVIETNYLTPIKYIGSGNIWDSVGGIGGIRSVKLSREGLELLLPLMIPDALVSYLAAFGQCGRLDLVKVIIEWIDQAEDNNDGKCECSSDGVCLGLCDYGCTADFREGYGQLIENCVPLSVLDSIEQYQEWQLILKAKSNNPPILSMYQLIQCLRGDHYGRLLRSIIDEYPLDKIMKLLIVVAKLLTNRGSNVELVEHLVSLVTVDQYRLFVTSEYAILRKQVYNDDEQEDFDILSPSSIERSYREMVIDVILNGHPSYNDSNRQDDLSDSIPKKIVINHKEIIDHKRAAIKTLLTPYYDIIEEIVVMI